MLFQDVYETFNILLRRKPKENNFKVDVDQYFKFRSVFHLFPGVTCGKFAFIVSPALTIDHFLYFHDVVSAMNSYWLEVWVLNMCVFRDSFVENLVWNLGGHIVSFCEREYMYFNEGEFQFQT